ncbi:hypothetical protein CR513_24711, partial [Mucuna pruriens]
MEAEERHRLVKERHMEALRAVEEREEELRHQLATMKATMEKLGGVAASPTTGGTQAFWAQPFNEEIDGITIPPNFHEVCLEVGDLFDIRKAKDETLKSYLARFNNATVRVNDPDQKFFMKAFQKGLRVGQFSDSLALRRPLSTEEIRTRVEKHIEVEEDQAERRSGIRDTQPTQQTGQKGENKYPPKPKNYPLTLTPLREKRAQILCNIYHTHLLKYPKEAKGRMMGANR